MANGPGDRILELGKELFAAMAQREKLSAELKKLSETIERISKEELPRLMEDAGIQSENIAGVGTFFLSTNFFASVLAQDRTELYEWMRAQGHGDLVQDHIHPRTFTSFAREQVENNNPLPDFVKTAFIPSVRTRPS